ncbi:Uu.00g001380.m01.CDS01 [Anthostomella pinea]|uniref:Uu.00g001380.m01.CDS01 n=1 Tax=Anthostomella pinea TaxID=933095 RepID=A0AAI8VJA1_9PEZI|nr:Uu.00g001380.m01.CDS01 [Anthostomella pinea]
MDDYDPFDGDEDAALRHAIALSLQEADEPGKPVELSSDDDEDDLERGPAYPPTPKRAAKEVEESAPATGTTKPSSSSSSQMTPSAQQPAAPAGGGSGGLSAFGLDRKKMEEERLARAAKRKMPHGPDELDGQEDRRRRVKLDAAPGAATATPVVPAVPAYSGPGQKGAAQGNVRGLPYPKGVVKKTWARGYPRKDDINIEEVLQKDELELAMISSFQWDEEWMLSKIDIKKTKMVLVAFASGEAQWGETGVMENVVFLIDLPLIEDESRWSSNTLTNFGEELRYFLQAQGLDGSLVNSLRKYDFSETDRYRLVHTIGQTHVGESWQRTGYCGLGRAVTSLGLGTSSDIDVDFVVASLGSVNADLLGSIYNAAQGDNGMKEYEERKQRVGKKKKTSAENMPALATRFRIYFPSQDTVVQSRGGKNAGGTICVQSKWWDSPSFPRELIRDCKSVRPGLLMHSKIMFVRHVQSGESKAAWAYVGSANLSESAWGRLVKDKATGQPKLNCRNWECGVVIPVPAEATAGGSSHTDLTAFENSIPVPMTVPGDAYGASASKRPWLFLEN